MFTNFCIKKYILIISLIYAVDYGGLFLHLNELEFERFFKPSILKIPEVQKHDSAERQYVLNPVEKCSGKGDEFRFLTVLIKSAVRNAQRRDYIRRTWGFEQRFSDVPLKRVFLLGLPAASDVDAASSLRKESMGHGDILQGNFTDAYFNNTRKTIMGINWAAEQCSKSQYFLFVDDDYYVSMKNVLRFLTFPAKYPRIPPGALGLKTAYMAQHDSSENLFAGYVLQTAPHRHKFSKWFISLKDYPFDKWPPYVTAGAFILSSKSLKQLAELSSSRHFMFEFDDIYLGVLAAIGNMSLTHCERFYFSKLAYNGPDSYRYAIASHGYDDSEQMEKAWTECRSSGYA